jgi:hypothetical protein
VCVWCKTKNKNSDRAGKLTIRVGELYLVDFTLFFAQGARRGRLMPIPMWYVPNTTCDCGSSHCVR